MIRRIRQIGVIGLIGLVLLTGIAHGTVPTTADSVSYDGDGNAVDFVFSFGVWSGSQVRVLLVDPNGTPMVQTLNSEYTVALPNDDGWLGPGGTVTFAAAPQENYRVVLERNIPYEQASPYSSAGFFDPSVLEMDLDKAAVRDMQLRRELQRALRGLDGEAIDMNLPNAAARASMYLAFDTQGRPTVVAGTGGGEIVSDPELSALAGLVSAPNLIPYFTGSGSASTIASTATGRAWIAATTGQFLLDRQADANNAEFAAALNPGVYNVKHYGAVGDGITNDTAAVQAAFDALYAAGGGILFFPPGTYRCEIVLDDVGVYDANDGTAGIGRYAIRGAGANCTRLKARTAGNFALTITGGTTWSSYWSIRDLTFDGGERSTGGISVAYNGVLGLHVQDCGFWKCSYGFKNTGALSYRFDFCSWERCDYGVWITASDTMHGGCGEFNQCNFYISSTASVYVNGRSAPKGTNTVDQLTFRGGINEGNLGFAFYVKNWAHGWPFLIDNVYLEGSGTHTSPVLIDGHSYGNISAAGIRFDNCPGTPVIQNCHAGWNTMDVNDTRVRVSQSWIYGPNGEPNCTGTGAVVYDRCFFESSNDIDSSMKQDGFYSEDWATGLFIPVRWTTIRVPIRENLVYDKRNLWTNGSMATPFTPLDVNGMTYSFETGDAPYHGRYLKIRLQPATAYDDGVRLFANHSVTSGRYYLWSFDIRSDANDVTIDMIDATRGGLRCSVPAVAGEWRRYYGWALATTTSTNSANQRIYNQRQATYETIHLANMQYVEFTAPEALLKFLNSGAYAMQGTPVSAAVARTVIRTIDLDDDASTDDYQFDDDAANATEQVIALTDILPAYAELVSWQIRCFEGVADANTATVQFGTSSGGTELADSATGCDDTNEILGTAVGAAPLLAATNAARTLYFAVTPSVNWNVMHSTGRWAVMITYIDYGAIYAQKNP